MMELAGKLLGIVRDERLMLATLGLATIAIVRSMYATLEDVRDENEIPPVETKAQYITQDTEDALQLDTLGKLLDHPTYSIREVGVKILCDRAVNDSETTTFLLRGITRPNYDDRMQCLRALALLTGQTAGTFPHSPFDSVFLLVFPQYTMWVMWLRLVNYRSRGLVQAAQ